jgi:hypothetical protein
MDFGPMDCKYCGKPVGLLRKLGKHSFCSDAHQQKWMQEHEALALSRLQESWAAAKAGPAPSLAAGSAPAPAPAPAADPAPAVAAVAVVKEPEPVEVRGFLSEAAVAARAPKAVAGLAPGDPLRDESGQEPVRPVLRAGTLWNPGEEAVQAPADPPVAGAVALAIGDGAAGQLGTPAVAVEPLSPRDSGAELPASDVALDTLPELEGVPVETVAPRIAAYAASQSEPEPVAFASESHVPEARSEPAVQPLPVAGGLPYTPEFAGSPCVAVTFAEAVEFAVAVAIPGRGIAGGSLPPVADDAAAPGFAAIALEASWSGLVAQEPEQEQAREREEPVPPEAGLAKIRFRVEVFDGGLRVSGGELPQEFQPRAQFGLRLRPTPAPVLSFRARVAPVPLQFRLPAATAGSPDLKPRRIRLGNGEN